LPRGEDSVLERRLWPAHRQLERFDDEYPSRILIEEAASITQTSCCRIPHRLQEGAGGWLHSLRIDVIAPSHGLMWTGHIPQILERYAKWSANETDPAGAHHLRHHWGSTRKMAYAIGDAL
jgi:flavorubredoxin